METTDTELKYKPVIHCPRCKCSAIHLQELAEATINWFQREDGMIEEGEQRPGSINKIIAKCSKCQHHWTIRGKIQITDIYEDYHKRLVRL